jgi:hypothetical protein
VSHALLAQGISSICTASSGCSGKVNLSGDWSTIWSSITKSGSGFGSISPLITLFGVVIILGSILRWAWARRTGASGGGEHKHVFGTLGFGVLLMAPGVVIPLFLDFADVIINAILSVV